MKRSKIFIIVITILMMFCGCQTKNEEKGISHTKYLNNLMIDGSLSANFINKQDAFEDVKEIMDRGCLNVAMIMNDIDVFSCEKNGKFQGIDVDLAKSLAKKLGVKLAINRRVKDYNALEQLLHNDEVDMIISMYSMTSYRAASVNFSNPYFISNTCLIANKVWLVKNKIEANPINYLREHKFKIAVVRGSSEKYLTEILFPQAEIVEVDSDDVLCNMVKEGKVVCGMASSIDCITNYTKHPESMIYTKSFLFEDDKQYFCVGISPKKEGLLKFVNACIKTMPQISIEDVEDRCKQLYNF